MANTVNELKNMVDYIANELKEIYNGDKVTELEEKKEELEIKLFDSDDEDEIAKLDSQIEDIEEEIEELSFYHYFNDALDIEYMIGADMRYRGTKIMIACGGPNIWVDTTRGEVFGAWGTDRETAWIPSEICNEIDSIFEEMFECAR